MKRLFQAIEKISRHDLPALAAETRIADLPLDSLDTISLVEELETQTGKHMTAEQLDEVDTLGDLATFFEMTE